MGIAVIGGLVFGSAMTLFVIPAVYVLLYREAAAPVTRSFARTEVGG